MASSTIRLNQGLVDLGYDIVSTGGSAASLSGAGLAVKKIEEVTGFPEMLDGMSMAGCAIQNV